MLIDSVNQIGFSNVEDDEISDEISAVIYHSIIVSNLAYKVGKELGFSKERCYELAYAGILHDIGKIHLNKKLKMARMDAGKRYKAEEMRYVRNHSIYSYNALKERDCSDYILDAVLYHHENFDGTGYPEGLNGNDIPQGARILRVCDVFSALVDRRIYREPLDIDSAVETMIDEVKNYDMKIFLAFQRVIHEDEMEILLSWIVEHNQNVEKRIEEKKQEKMRENRKRKVAKMLK